MKQQKAQAAHRIHRKKGIDDAAKNSDDIAAAGGSECFGHAGYCW
jgi:hypothetical protein